MATAGADEVFAPGNCWRKTGIRVVPVLTLSQVAPGLFTACSAAVLITEESLSGRRCANALALALDAQPSWSDYRLSCSPNGATRQTAANGPVQRMDRLKQSVCCRARFMPKSLVRRPCVITDARGRQHQARSPARRVAMRERQLFRERKQISSHCQFVRFK